MYVKYSSYEDREERKTLVKTLEEYTQDRAVDGQEELVLIQVSLVNNYLCFVQFL